MTEGLGDWLSKADRSSSSGRSLAWQIPASRPASSLLLGEGGEGGEVAEVAEAAS